MVAPGAHARATLARRARRWSVARLARQGAWLVIAPHPDDEALGAGAMLAALAEAGADPHVAFITDGAGSHAGAPGWSAKRLAAARRIEARHALAALGVTAPPLHLDWPDASPFAPGSADHAHGVRRLAAHCRRHRIRRIAVCWAGEPHCDHAAAAEIARAVRAAAPGRIALFSYLVWGWTLPDLATRARHQRTLSIDVARHRPAQRRAIDCHRSQTGTRIAGARHGFRLPRAMIALARQPRTILLEERGVRAYRARR